MPKLTAAEKSKRLSGSPQQPSQVAATTSSTPSATTQVSLTANATSAEIQQALNKLIIDATFPPEQRQKMQANLLGRFFLTKVKERAVARVADLPAAEQFAVLERTACAFVDSILSKATQEPDLTEEDEYEAVHSEDDTLGVLSGDDELDSGKTATVSANKRPQKKLEEGGIVVDFPAAGKEEDEAAALLTMYDAVVDSAEEEKKQVEDKKEEEGWFPSLRLWGQ